MTNGEIIKCMFPGCEFITYNFNISMIIEKNNMVTFSRIWWEREYKQNTQSHMFEYEGKIYVGKDLVIKSKDKDGICSFYGFEEVE